MVRLLWSHTAQILRRAGQITQAKAHWLRRQAVFSKSLPANSKRTLEAGEINYQPNCTLVELGNRHESCADS